MSIMASSIDGKDIDNEELDNGDLGLGEGLKPGALPKIDPSDPFPGSQCQKPDLTTWEERFTPDAPQHKPKLTDKLLRRTRQESQGENERTEFPSFDEVPFGTSLKQHKKLLEHHWKEIYNKNMGSPIMAAINRKDVNRQESYSKLTLEEKLIRAEQEVDTLKQDLENAQRRLDAKYKAIQILQQQMQSSSEHQHVSEQKAKEQKQQLERMVNQLEFDLVFQRDSLMSSQETWASRFDRACQENSCLMHSLEKRSEDIRKLQAEKMSLTRQRDELLALLDVKDRSKYESSRRSSLSDDQYNDYTSEELSVLGACRCRMSDPEPCGCAHAAANLKKEISRLQEETHLHKNRKEEALNTIDAYRIAFEEQLNRSRDLTSQIAKMAMPTQSKTIKAKNVLKWVIHQLNEDEPAPPQPQSDEAAPPKITITADGININCTTEQELIQSLIDVLNDRNEALAHQRLAAKMLANRTQELEGKLSQKGATEEVLDFETTV